MVVRDLATDVPLALEANNALSTDTSLLSAEITSFNEAASSDVPNLILQMDELLLAFGVRMVKIEPKTWRDITFHDLCHIC